VAGDRVAQDGDRPVHTDCLQRRAQAARDRATELVKTSEQLLAHADVLAREADVAIAEARRSRPARFPGLGMHRRRLSA